VLAVQNGKHLDTNEPIGQQVLEPNQAAILTSILEGVVQEGTGRRARLDDRPAAGKTGTTENYGDAWFVGYTPQLAVAIWVGYPDRLQPMLTEFHGEAVAGGTYPALIWRAFMKSALRYLDESPESFPAPYYGNTLAVQVALRDGVWMRDNGQCKDAHTFVFFAGYEPQETASCSPNEVEVPRVVGAKVLDATARLAAQPLQAQVIYRWAKPGIERPGIVLEQFPASGTLAAFDTVRLIVARARGTIPRVVGMPLAEAQLRLADRDLEGEVKELVEGESGIVLAQEPQAGIAAGPGMTVRLVVGDG
jgi:hypothetical protein